MGQGALGPLDLRIGPIGLRIRPIRPIAFDELHIWLLDNLPVDGRPDMLAPRIVDVHLVVDWLRGGGGLLLRHRNGLQLRRLEASKPERRERRAQPRSP